MFETPQSAARVEDWFDNVENLRPLRGGRRAGTLNEIASGLISVSSEEAEKKFREDFELANTLDDPLSIMWSFTNWFEEHFPTGKHRIFYPMLYKICTTYAVDERYKNDERMLKLWLKLAESFPESALAVMEFAHTKGSCRQLAKFYVRWSEMYQNIGYLHRARDKIELGMAMFAMPLPLLHEALDTINAQIEMNVGTIEDELESAAADHDLENCRETLGRLRGLGREHAAPIIRIAQGPPGRIMQQRLPIRSTIKRHSTAEGGNAAAHFQIFEEDSPSFSITEQKLCSNTPMVRRRLVDDLADDPDYQALFGFFDDREKVDLQFSAVENSCKPACKFVSSASVVKSKRRGIRNLGVRLPPLDFEVFADDSGCGEDDQIKEENEEVVGTALCNDSNTTVIGEKKASRKTTKKPDAPKKARLCMKKCLVEEMSVEEAFPQHLRNRHEI